MLTSSYPRYAGDGAGSFIGSLSRSLVAQGHSIHVVAPHDPAVRDTDQGGVSVHRFRYAPARLSIAGHGSALQADTHLRSLVPLLMPGYAIASAAVALRLHRRQGFDLLHAHWSVPGGAIGGALARLTGLPLVISLHGSDVYLSERDAAAAAGARFGFRRAMCVTACSEDLRTRSVSLGLDDARTTVIPYGVDLERYGRGQGWQMRERLHLPQNAPVIGALGRLVRKKGFEHLVDAMGLLARSRPQPVCVIAGDGDLAGELRARAERLGLGGRIVFTGQLDWRDTPDFYAMCDVVAVPSVRDTQGNVDGLPNVLLEALASGRPVVASQVAGIPQVVDHGRNGLLVEPGDAVALAAALRDLLDDSDRRSALGLAARTSMEQSSEWADVARRFGEIYKRVVSGQAGANTPCFGS